MPLYITPWVDYSEGVIPQGVEGARSWGCYDLRPTRTGAGDALVLTSEPVAALAGRETTKAAARQRINAAFPDLVSQPVLLMGEVL